MGVLLPQEGMCFSQERREVRTTISLVICGEINMYLRHQSGLLSPTELWAKASLRIINHLAPLFYTQITSHQVSLTYYLNMSSCFVYNILSGGLKYRGEKI